MNAVFLHNSLDLAGDGEPIIKRKKNQNWASPSFPDTSNDMMCSRDRHDKNPKELHG